MASKVPPPVFTEDCTYADWKVDVQLWSRSIYDSQLSKKQKSIALYQSLPAPVRKTVLSTITIDDIDSDDGVKNIFKAMDKFYQKDEVRTGCTEIKKLLRYRRPKDVPLDKFFIEMNLLMNKVENHGIGISDPFKAVILLDCANLSDTKTELCNATCPQLTLDNMRTQIEKVGADDESSATTGTHVHHKLEQSIKTEPVVETLYVQNCIQCGSESVLSSDEESQPHETFYANKRRGHRFQLDQKPHGSKDHQIGQFSSKRTTRNPQNKYGYYTSCDYCQCTYHYLPDCPYAPEEIKMQYNFKKQMRLKRGHQNQHTF